MSAKSKLPINSLSTSDISSVFGLGIIPPGVTVHGVNCLKTRRLVSRRPIIGPQDVAAAHQTLENQGVHPVNGYPPGMTNTPATHTSAWANVLPSAAASCTPRAPILLSIDISGVVHSLVAPAALCRTPAS